MSYSTQQAKAKAMRTNSPHNGLIVGREATIVAIAALHRRAIDLAQCACRTPQSVSVPIDQTIRSRKCVGKRGTKFVESSDVYHGSDGRRRSSRKRYCRGNAGAVVGDGRQAGGWAPLV